MNGSGRAGVTGVRCRRRGARRRRHRAASRSLHRRRLDVGECAACARTVKGRRLTAAAAASTDATVEFDDARRSDTPAKHRHSIRGASSRASAGIWQPTRPAAAERSRPPAPPHLVASFSDGCYRLFEPRENALPTGQCLRAFFGVGYPHGQQPAFDECRKLRHHGVVAAARQRYQFGHCAASVDEGQQRPLGPRLPGFVTDRDGQGEHDSGDGITRHALSHVSSRLRASLTMGSTPRATPTSSGPGSSTVKEKSPSLHRKKSNTASTACSATRLAQESGRPRRDRERTSHADAIGRGPFDCRR